MLFYALLAKYINVFVSVCILPVYSAHHCMTGLDSTNRTEPVTHESLRSACEAAPGICVVQPAAGPAKCFGRTELKKKGIFQNEHKL